MSRPYITTQYMLLISDRMQNRRLEEMSMAMVDGCGCYWEGKQTQVFISSHGRYCQAINKAVSRITAIWTLMWPNITLTRRNSRA